MFSNIMWRSTPPLYLFTRMFGVLYRKKMGAKERVVFAHNTLEIATTSNMIQSHPMRPNAICETFSNTEVHLHSAAYSMTNHEDSHFELATATSSYYKEQQHLPSDGTKEYQERLCCLPIDFEPSPFTIIIGRGKKPRDNVGNRRLRVIASFFLPRYSEATDASRRSSKTRIVNEVFETIRSAGGSFVKRLENGRWMQVSDSVAREKIGYVFRDLLSDKYRSSSKSKIARRRLSLQGKEMEDLTRSPLSRTEAPDSLLRASSDSSILLAPSSKKSLFFDLTIPPPEAEFIRHSNFETPSSCFGLAETDALHNYEALGSADENMRRGQQPSGLDDVSVEELLNWPVIENFEM